MSVRAYVLTVEPRGFLYEQLLDVGLEQCAQVGFIVQRKRSYPASVDDLLERLSPYLIESKETDEWPGSRMAIGWSEQLYLYRFVNEVNGLLQFVANGLFDWQNPKLPDDLHLLRADGSVWLVNIAHENEAWLELAESEYSRLQAIAPSLAGILRPDVPPGHR